MAREHEHRADNIVLYQRQGKHPPVAEHRAHLLIPHFSQRWVHHEDEANSNRNRSGAYLKAGDEARAFRIEIAQPYSQTHSQEYPEGKEAFKQWKPFLLRHEKPLSLLQSLPNTHFPPTNNLRVLFRLLNPLFDLFRAGNSAFGNLIAINDKCRS